MGDRTIGLLGLGVVAVCTWSLVHSVLKGELHSKEHFLHLERARQPILFWSAVAFFAAFLVLGIGVSLLLMLKGRHGA